MVRPSLPASPLFLSRSCFQAGRLSVKKASNSSEECACDSTSQSRNSSHITPWIQNHSLDPNEAAHQLYPRNRTFHRFCKIASSKETPVYMHRIYSLPSCKERYALQNTIAVDLHSRCDCKHSGNSAVWQYLFSIPRCPFSKNVLRPNAANAFVDWKRMAGDGKHKENTTNVNPKILLLTQSHSTSSCVWKFTTLFSWLLVSTSAEKMRHMDHILDTSWIKICLWCFFGVNFSHGTQEIQKKITRLVW